LQIYSTEKGLGSNELKNNLTRNKNHLRQKYIYFESKNKKDRGFKDFFTIKTR